MSGSDDVGESAGWSKREMDDMEREIRSRAGHASPEEIDGWFHGGGKDWLDRTYPRLVAMSRDRKPFEEYEAALAEADGDHTAAWSQLDPATRRFLFDDAERSQQWAAHLMRVDDRGRASRPPIGQWFADNVKQTAAVVAAVALIALGLFVLNSGGSESVAPDDSAAEAGDSAETQGSTSAPDSDPEPVVTGDDAPAEADAANGDDGETHSTAAPLVTTPGSDVTGVAYRPAGPNHVITLTFAGDGEALAGGEATVSYMVVATVEDDTSYASITSRASAEGDVESFAEIDGAHDGEIIDAGWVDPSTYEILFSYDGFADPVTGVLAGVNVEVSDDAGDSVYYSDSMVWVAP